MQVLRTEHNIQNEKDLDNIKNYVILIQKGISPGVVLANTLQNRLFQAAPVKQRRAKNKQLCTEAGAIVTSDEFVQSLEKQASEKVAEKAAKAAKRKSGPTKPSQTVRPKKLRSLPS